MQDSQVSGAAGAPLQGGASPALVRVPVSMNVMLGTARLPLSELLALKQGSTFNLEQKLGEPVTIIVNGCKIASGELFVLEGDKLGVKVKEIFDGNQSA